MLLSQIAFRTFFIRGLQYGTAFTIDIENTEYIITARHLIPSDKSEFSLQIMKDENWLHLPARVIKNGSNDIDISILKAEERLSPNNMPVSLGISGLALGQDVFFSGFPFKLWGDFKEAMNGWPVPFIKKGIISSYSISSQQEIYVDAFNNEGFSGGPLFFSPSSTPSQIQIIGVVSKYRTETENVMDEKGNKTALSFSLNTGLLIAYSIEHALQMVTKSRT